jgi:peroxiredoxin
MKKFMIAALAVAMFSAACKEKKQGAFVVTGNIVNATGKKVLLMEIPYSSPEPVVLDSTMLGDKGSYTLKANAQEEGIYRLALENGPDVILVNDGKTIRINMDVNDYANYTVEESPATKSLQDLFHVYRKDDSALLTTFKQLDTLQRKPGNDSLVSLVKGRRDGELKTMNSHLGRFIEQSPSAAATFYGIGLASRTMPPEELKPIVDAASSKFKEHSGLARVKSLLTQQLAVKTPDYKLLNQPAPDFTMPDAKGKPTSLSNFKGKYVLLDFWASWCGPCRAENPNVVTAYNKYKSKNFTVVGVSLDQDKAAWLGAIEHDNLKWPQISDLKMWESAAVSLYGIDAIPFNVLIDPQGVIIAHSLRGPELDAKLATILQ